MPVSPKRERVSAPSGLAALTVLRRFLPSRRLASKITNAKRHRRYTREHNEIASVEQRAGCFDPQRYALLPGLLVSAPSRHSPSVQAQGSTSDWLDHGPVSR